MHRPRPIPPAEFEATRNPVYDHIQRLVDRVVKDTATFEDDFGDMMYFFGVDLGFFPAYVPGTRRVRNMNMTPGIPAYQAYDLLCRHIRREHADQEHLVAGVSS